MRLNTKFPIILLYPNTKECFSNYFYIVFLKYVYFSYRKKDERLDWMYQGPAAMVNRDEYLLGRKIDKTLETLQQIEKGGEPEKEEGKNAWNFLL